jgi:hypothetical protein
MGGTAKFEFPKGEFHAYDLIGNRIQAVSDRSDEPPVFEEQELLEYELLFEAAVSALESQL